MPAPAGGVRASLIEIGTIVKPHGVRGELKVRLHHRRSSILEEIDPALLVLRDRHGNTRRGVSRAGDALLRIDGVTDRDAAESLRGAVVLAPRSAVVLAHDEVLVADLVGCEVFADGVSVGRVATVIETGAGEVLVVRNEREERLIPFVDQWVARVEIARRRIDLDGGDVWEPQPLREDG